MDTLGGSEIKNEETKDLIARYMKDHADLVSKLSDLTSKIDPQSDKLSDNQQHEVSWKGQRVTIPNEKLRTVLLVNAQKLARDVADNDSKIEAKLFGAYADAMKMIKEEITTIQKTTGGKGKAKDPEEQNLTSLQEYVTYLKLLASIQRSVILADTAATVVTTTVSDVAPVSTSIKKKHPDEMARLYENLINGMEELESLLQGAAQDAEEVKANAARLIFYKAARCYWLAVSFATLQNTDKALALFERALQHAELASASFAACRSVALDKERLERLVKDITAARAKSRAKAFLGTLETQTQPLTKASSLVTGLNNYDTSFLADKHITDFPPSLQAIPCKPLLFDLALNDCSFPDLEARKKAQQSKGFFGFWRS